MYDVTEWYNQGKYDMKKKWNQFEKLGVKQFVTEFMTDIFEVKSEQLSVSDNHYMALYVEGELEYDDNRISHFALANDDLLLMICFDENEGIVVYKLN